MQFWKSLRSNFAPEYKPMLFCRNFLRNLAAEYWWNFTPIVRRVLLTRHFHNSLSVYLSVEFESQLGKSEKFNNQGIKENKAFRIPFITKKQLKSRQALHRIFLKPQYKVYRGASILYFNASFSDVPSFSKMSQPPGQNQQMALNSTVYHPCSSRLASRLTLTFIRHLTLIKSNLSKQKKLVFSFE